MPKGPGENTIWNVQTILKSISTEIDNNTILFKTLWETIDTGRVKYSHNTYLYSSCSFSWSKHAVFILTGDRVMWFRNFRGTANLQEHIDQSNEKAGGLRR